ncbi:uncharacterized protein JCM10292_002137 [Rhodotorula paludigena]|uniref:uncharacterized protein n=1 Tax=Rhodotorula paludigena TaxID=86838 RepID=UPI00317EB195
MPWIPTNEGLVVLSLVAFILFSARLPVQPDQLEGAIAWVWHYTWHVHLTLSLIHILDSVPPRRARNAVIQAYRSICRPARPLTTLVHARQNLCASVELAVAAALASIRADGALQDARRNLASVLEACDAAPLNPSLEQQLRLLAYEQLKVTQLHYRQMGAFCTALRDSWQILVSEARESTATSLNDPAMLLGTKVVVLGEIVARLYQAHNERVDEVIACLEAHSEPGWCAVVADLVRAGWTFLSRLVGRKQPGAPVSRLLLDDARPEHLSQ